MEGSICGDGDVKDDKILSESIPRCGRDGSKASPGPGNYMEMEGSIGKTASDSGESDSFSIPTNDGVSSCNYVYVEDSVFGSGKDKGVDNASCFLSTSEVGFSFNDADLYTDKTVENIYTDKTVTEIEYLEPLANFKQNGIKDICIDEEPSLDKILIDDEVGHERIQFLRSELAENGHLTKEIYCQSLTSDNAKSFVFEGDFISREDKILAVKQSTESSLDEGGQNVGLTKDIINAISDGRSVPEESFFVQKLEMGNLHDDSPSSAKIQDEHLYDQEHVQKLSESVNVRPEDAAEEATPVSPSVALGFSDSSNVVDSTTGSEAESGRITLSLEPLPAEMSSSRQETTGNTDFDQPGWSFTASVLDDGALDSLTGSTRSFFIQHGLQDSTVSGMDSVSGPIVHSVTVPYSGSISFRSDSSTTSTRSFAFPTLQSEWNSSPIPMAKADGRHLRRHRGWKVALLCCRF